MGIYDVDTENGDLFSKQQQDHARQSRDAGRQRVLDLKAKRMTSVTRAKARQFEQPRGTGMTGRTTLPFTDADRDTILMLHGAGTSYSEIGKRIGRSYQKVKTVIEEAKLVSLRAGLNWRELMKDKAVSAVNDALDAKDDLYKRGSLGIQTLKGLGEFEADSGGNLTQIINSIPPDMRDRYLSSDEGVIEATVTEVRSHE